MENRTGNIILAVLMVVFAAALVLNHFVFEIAVLWNWIDTGAAILLLVGAYRNIKQ